MVIKKFLPILLCGTMVFGLTGCGLQKQKAESVPEQPQVQSVVETPIPTPEEEPKEKQPEYKATDEISESNALHPAFQMGDTVAILGETLVSELIDAGAELEPNDKVTDLNQTIRSNTEAPIILSYKEFPFKLRILNDNKNATSVKNCTIIEVYADQGPLFGIGGVKIGDSVDRMTFNLGEPYEKVDGYEYSSDFTDLSAYFYSSAWDDKNVVFFVNDEYESVVSFKESLPKNYITSAALLNADLIENLIKKREQAASEYVLKTPSIVDVENSNYALGSLEDVKYTTVKVYGLDEITDPPTFNMEVVSMENYIPKSYLVVEYEGTIKYPKEEIEHLEFLEQKLNDNYQVHGCFYVLDSYVEDGEIKSGTGFILTREMDGVYENEETMLADLIKENKEYSMESYNVDEFPIG